MNGEIGREDVEFLRQTVLFEGLGEADRRMIERVVTPGYCRKKQMVFLPDDPATAIYILKAGRVKIAKLTEDGKEIILSLLKPNDVFGEMAIIDQGPRECFAEALDNVVYFTIRLEDLYRLMKSRPAIIIRLAKVIGQRRIEAEKNMESFLYKGVRERLAQLLLRLSRDYGIKDARGRLLRIKITHQDLANIIGSSRETVSLTLGDFRRAGLIDINERKIIIKDEQALQGIA
jgi:CRP-like cAMP-binding protein